MTEQSTPPTSLTVRRIVGGSPEKAYDAWTVPELMNQWSPPSEGSTYQFDVRVGGNYLMNIMHEGQLLPHSGEYKVLDRPRKVMQTWTSPATGGQETVVTIEFKAAGDKTEVMLTHSALPANAVDAHRAGWDGVLEMMQAWLTNT